MCLVCAGLDQALSAPIIYFLPPDRHLSTNGLEGLNNAKTLFFTSYYYKCSKGTHTETTKTNRIYFKVRSVSFSRCKIHHWPPALVTKVKLYYILRRDQATINSSSITSIGLCCHKGYCCTVATLLLPGRISPSSPPPPPPTPHTRDPLTNHSIRCAGTCSR